MKKLLVVVVALALSLPMLAWSASSYVTAFPTGKFKGEFKSVVPEQNGPATMEVKSEGGKVVATVESKGGKEVWSWDEKVLTQQEVDAKTNKVAQQYTATAPAAPAGTKQTYKINCASANQCDAGIDSRNYWVIETTPNTIRYTVFGVSGDKKADPKATPVQRHDVTFTKAN